MLSLPSGQSRLDQLLDSTLSPSCHGHLLPDIARLARMRLNRPRPSAPQMPVSASRCWRPTIRLACTRLSPGVVPSGLKQTALIESTSGGLSGGRHPRGCSQCQQGPERSGGGAATIGRGRSFRSSISIVLLHSSGLRRSVHRHPVVLQRSAEAATSHVRQRRRAAWIRRKQKNPTGHNR